MKTIERPESLSDDLLLARVEDLARRNRRVEAELIWHLAEVDRRQLYRREACPSMHVYATARLHLSDAEAFLRIAVARVSRRFPVVLRMLADGRLHLSAIGRLGPHLSETNCDALLAEAVHLSKREIEKLVARLAPRPDVPSGMRRLPRARRESLVPGEVGCRGVAADEAAREAANAGKAGGADARGTQVGNAALAISAPSSEAPAPQASTSTEIVPQPESSRPESSRPPALPTTLAPQRLDAAVSPLAEDRYRVQFTAGEELHEKIVRAQALMRHQVPDGDLAVVFDRAMTLLVRELERVRFAATDAPRKTAEEADPTPSSRRIPDPVKREVWRRDGGQCTFHDRRGRRCPAREWLEFHHLIPFARGGEHSVGNLALRCSTHNAYQAEMDFGAGFVASRRAARERGAGPGGGGRCGEARSGYGGDAGRGGPGFAAPPPCGLGFAAPRVGLVSPRCAVLGTPVDG